MIDPGSAAVSRLTVRVVEAATAATASAHETAARIAGIETAGQLADIEQHLRCGAAGLHAAYCEAVRRDDGEAADVAVGELRRLVMDAADAIAGERLRLSRDHAARVRALASRV